LETFPVGWRARAGLHRLLYRQEDIRLAAGGQQPDQTGIAAKS
jgi:hypothetical protein